MKPVRWTDGMNHPTPWRAGRSVHRTIYDANEVLIGMMDTAELAAQVIAAVNAHVSTTRPEPDLTPRGAPRVKPGISHNFAQSVYDDAADDDGDTPKGS